MFCFFFFFFKFKVLLCNDNITLYLFYPFLNSLSDNKITSEGFNLLLNKLSNFKNVIFIEIDNNLLDDKCIIPLCNFIKNNKKIEYISIEKNKNLKNLDKIKISDNIKESSINYFYCGTFIDKEHVYLSLAINVINKFYKTLDVSWM